MNILRAIDKPLAGEHVLLTVPPLGPYARAAAGAPGLRRRLNFFPQRSLTDIALNDEQRSRGDDLLRLGQSVAPGVVDGFELALDGTTLALLPGHAISAAGQTLTLAYPLRVEFDQVIVVSPQVDARLAAAVAPASGTRSSAWQRQATLAQVLSQWDGASYLPHAMVLVALPRNVAIDRSDAAQNACPNASGEGVVGTAAWEDGLQLAWVPWPADRSLPPWTTDGGISVDSRLRNRLAYAIFNAERERLSPPAARSMRQWNERAKLSPAQRDAISQAQALADQRNQPWPWDGLGVALSVVAFDARFKPVFADRAAVVRQGGGRRNRSVLVPFSGDDTLWQARVSQLLEHLAELPPGQINPQTLVSAFDWLPPAGVLPLPIADFNAGRQLFFPPSFDVQAQPVPIDMVDALIAESSSLAPFNLSLRDQVQLLVPVPARFFDPDLLKLHETINPLFDLEVSRLEASRQQLLTRRDGLRRRYDTLTQAVTGKLPAYPADDPNGLPDEGGAGDSLAFARVRQTTVAAGQTDWHGFSGARQTLALDVADDIVVFVRLSAGVRSIALKVSSHPPRTASPPAHPTEASVTSQAWVWGDWLMTTFTHAVPVASKQTKVVDFPFVDIPQIEKPVLRIEEVPLVPQQLLGGLPAAGEWVRLAAPVSRLGLGGRNLDGLQLGVVAVAGSDVQVTWGYAGKSSNGIETYWLSDAFPVGASATGTVNWQVQGEGFDAAQDQAWGVAIETPPASGDAPATVGSRHVAEVDKLVANWTAFNGGVLAVELGQSGINPDPVDAGLGELIARLGGRIRSISDHVDFGFLRARTDIFRIRQSVLGTENAGRFLTSATAAELVTRNANPVATEQDFGAYFSRLDAAVSGTPYAPAQHVVQLGNAAAAAVGTFFEPTAMFGGLGLSSNPSLFGALSKLGASPVKAGVSADTQALQSAAASSAAAKAAAATPTSKSGTSALLASRASQISVEAPAVIKDVVGASLLGATYNTVTVADRFAIPAAVLSNNTAAKGKSDFVTNSVTSLRDIGLIIDDLPVYGYKSDTNKTKLKVTDLDVAGWVDTDLAPTDDPTNQHESVYFRRGIDATDNLVRFLRQLELRAEDYRRLLADAQASRDRILNACTNLQKLAAGLADQLAEVRHDLSVARSLRTEEQARLAALLARRRAILAEQVPYLVFRRPRLTAGLLNVPVLAAQPAQVADPVPRCRADAHDAPPELLAFVDTLREVPVRWIKVVSREFVKLDRVSDLKRLVDEAGRRLASPPAPTRVELIQGLGTITGELLDSSFARHAQRVEATRSDAKALLGQLDASTWKAAIEPVQALATIRDLLHVTTVSQPVTLAAMGLVDDIAGVASCLHAAFGQVSAVTRMRWAELFSQLDPAVSLRQLTVLPGFGDPRSGIGFIAWRQMQTMVDWLFAQVVAEAQPQSAINDLVRVCLLLAAHAPVKSILGARVQRPQPAVVNTAVDVEIDPRLTRIGAGVLIHSPAAPDGSKPAQVVARGVVEDIKGDGAKVRITHLAQDEPFTLDGGVKVQVQTAAPLSTAKVQQAEAAAARAAAVPAAAASAAAKKNAAVAVAAEESRVAKQVAALQKSGSRAAAGR